MKRRKRMKGYLRGWVIMGMVALLLVSAFATARAQATASVAVDLDLASSTGITPEGLVSDSTGRLYIADTASHRLWRYTPATNSLEVVGTLPRATTGMAFDKDGNLYFAS